MFLFLNRLGKLATDYDNLLYDMILVYLSP